MDDIVKWRRWFHSHPELAFSEEETKGYITSLLTDWGIPWKGWAKTGVVATLGEGNPIIGIRTDMDALLVVEENDVPYKSLYPGRMHACGHDGHMAILLGLIRALKEEEDHLTHRIVFIFQPAEEIGKGAELMVREGIISHYGIQKVIGYHLFSSIPSGIIGAREGVIMAEGDKFSIKIEARGAHGATPWLSHDVIAMGTSLVQGIFSNLTRRISPISEQVVISIGKLHAGTAFNVIPKEMEIEGTIRSLSHRKRDEVISLLKKVVIDFADMWGARAEIEIDRVFPPVVNDKGLYEKLKEAVSSSDFTFQEVYPTTISEDFSFFSEEVPGLYFFIGIRNEKKGIIYPHHHPRFNIDEDMLLPSVLLLKEFVLSM